MNSFKGHGFDFKLGKRTYIMGILNVTPDSFSDGGDFFSLDDAVSRAKKIEAEGADIIDIGAQSTRPGYVRISPAKELSRLSPVIDALKSEISIPISVDTFYPDVAADALRRGACIINDVSGFSNSMMIKTVADSDCGCIVMHPGSTSYPGGIVNDVRAFLKASAAKLQLCGIDSSRICLDPGVGFGKNTDECLEIIRRTSDIKIEPYAYMMAVSRKRVIGYSSGNPPFKDRLAGTVAANTVAQLGGADILRVHDVKEAVQAAGVTDAIMYGINERLNKNG